MSITPVSGNNFFPYINTAKKDPLKPQSAEDLAAQKAADGKQAVKDFLEFTNKSIAERMQDAWLKAHGLTKEELDKMTPEQRDAIDKQMAQEIEDKMKDAEKTRSKLQFNILV